MMPANGAFNSSALAYSESGIRGYCKFTVWIGMNGWTRTYVSWEHINKPHKRSMRRARNILTPVLKLWASSDFHFTTDLQDFVISVLGPHRYNR